MRSEKVEKMREQILNGPIVKTLILLAYPLIINQLVQVLYNLTDTFWLGKLGSLSSPPPERRGPSCGSS